MSDMSEIQKTHWEGCWRYHRDCAIRYAERAHRERYEAVELLRGEIKDALIHIESGASVALEDNIRYDQALSTFSSIRSEARGALARIEEARE